MHLMPLPTFKTSSAFSMGVELELQLLNQADHDLVPMAAPLLAAVERTPHAGEIKPEITQSMIEISTSVQTQHGPLLAELRALRDRVVAGANELGIRVSGGGTHPFQKWSDRRIYKKERFEQLSALYGYLAKQFTVFGQHVHIGCTEADEALRLVHCLGRYIPHFIALSASSPFLQGVDTDFDSARLNSIFAFPLSGRAPFILDWNSFERDYFDKMTALGVVHSMKDFYWDIRPKPEYGTVEVRVCDTPLTVERAAALAAYIQMLSRYLVRERPFEPAEDDYLAYTYNRFQACRFGLDGVLVDTRTRTRTVVRDDIIETLQRLESHASVLGADAAWREIRELATGEGNDATWLRATHAKVGSLAALVGESALRWAGAADAG